MRILLAESRQGFEVEVAPQSMSPKSWRYRPGLTDPGTASFGVDWTLLKVAGTESSVTACFAAIFMIGGEPTVLYSGIVTPCVCAFRGRRMRWQGCTGSASASTPFRLRSYEEVIE